MHVNVCVLSHLGDYNKTLDQSVVRASSPGSQSQPQAEGVGEAFGHYHWRWQLKFRQTYKWEVPSNTGCIPILHTAAILLSLYTC